MLEPTTYELTAGQLGIWHAERLDPGSSSAYFTGEYLEILGPLDVGAFESALRRAVSEADGLHLRFRTNDSGEVRQRVRPCDDWRLHLVDVSGTSEPRSAAEEWMRAALRKPLDLEEQPLFVQALFTAARDRFFWFNGFHHLALDAFGSSLVARRVGELYTEILRGSAVQGADGPLEPVSVLLDADAAYRSSSAYAQDREFWLETLQDAPSATSLSGREVTTTSSLPLRHTRDLAHEEMAALRVAAERLGTRLSGLFIAAAAVFLHRSTGAEDLLIGLPVLGRDRGRQRRAAGTTANVLPLRLTVRPRMSLGELLEQTSTRVRAALRHQRYRYEEMRRDLKRVGEGGDLVGMTVNIQSFDAVAFDDCVTRAHLLSFGPCDDFALTLYDRSFDGSAELNFDASPHRYTPQETRSHAKRFMRVLEWIEAAAPHDNLGTLKLLDEGERRRLLEEWNATSSAFPDTTWPQLFEAQVACSPDAVAVVGGGHEVTYAELDQRANRLARWLTARGVGPEALVGVVMERSVDVVVALLGVMKAGGGYVPVDPAYPAERVAFMLEDSRPAAVLTDRASAGVLPESIGGPVLVLDDAATADELAGFPDSGLTNAERGAPLGPRNTAYVIYTSGSTGRPKGVAVEHRSLVNYVQRCKDVFPELRHSAVLHHTISFDAMATAFHALLTCGGRIYLAQLGTELADMLGGSRAAFLDITPSHLPLLKAAPEACAPTAQLLLGAEPLHAAQLHEWRRAHPEVEVTNEYGPTEATVGCTAYQVAPGEELTEGDVPIGRPIANMRAYVLDAYLQPVPPGSAGELYVAGTGVARGYVGRAGLTAERFVACPFGNGDRMYRTGDLARWNSQGQLEFVGRADDQVKVHGARVELGEVEAALAEHEQVDQVAVLAHGDTPGDKRLVAYVVPRAGAQVTGEPGSGRPDAARLRKDLARELPRHMVPSTVVFLDALPLTVNGKVDRKALPAPGREADAAGSGRLPATPREQSLCAGFAEVLGLETVGVDENFFELGGHSLLAVALVERLRREGVAIDVRTLFTSPTVADLAAAIGEEEVAVPPCLIPEGAQTVTPEMVPLAGLTAQELQQIAARVPGGAANIEDIYPLAPLQEGFLFRDLMRPDDAGLSEEGHPDVQPNTSGDGAAYVLSVVLGFASEQRLNGYLAALQRVIERHDCLRGAVLWEGLREPVQVVARRATLPVYEVTLESGSDPIPSLLAKGSGAFDLGRAPLVRAFTAPDPSRKGHRLALLQVHHLVQDHKGLEVMLQEVRAFLEGREAELPVPLSFRNYVGQARLRMTTQQYERFFDSLLGDVQQPTTPFGLVEVGDGTAVSSVRRAVAPEVVQRLHEQARRLGVSAATLFHVAWARVVAAASGHDDVVFGTVLFGRLQGGAGSDRGPGLYINTLPARVRDGGVGVEDAVRGMHRQLADLLVHEHAPLALAVRSSGIVGRRPLFTSLLNFRHVSAEELAVHAQLAGAEWLYAGEATDVPLTASVDATGTGFDITVDAAEPADASAVCDMLLTATEGLLTALETAPETPLRRLEVLDTALRGRLLEEWGAGREAVSERTLPRLFEEQVKRSPGAVAVECGDEKVSYAELNERANRLARLLLQRGAGPESLVAVVMERSVRWIVALLGVSKAGAGHVPVDPAYPAQRIAFMLGDTAPVVVLTDSAVAPRLPQEADLSVVPVDDPAVSAELEAMDSADPTDAERSVPLSVRHPAYVIYTSGSTGRPKGVVVSHTGIAAMAATQARALAITPDSRVLQLVSPSFDVSISDVCGALLTGATLVQAPGADLLSALTNPEIEVTHAAVPASVLAAADPARVSASTLTVGGEACSAQLVARWAPGGRLVNAYGPTEATVCATMSEPLTPAAAPPPIGRPVAGTRVYVLDAALCQTPPGVVGELYITGVGLARGYLGRPALTAERFVADPYGPSGTRMYRTGDLVRWNGDGNLEFVSRADEQVKVRGHRVEPGEIETVLSAHPQVSHAAVVARDNRLVAYVVPAARNGAPLPDLHAHTASRLPGYMVPSAFVPIDTLPVTAHGKLDRAALPEPELSTTSAVGRPLRNSRERLLAKLFAEVLRVPQVGAEDSFFDLGGHSLLALRLVTRVRETLGAEMGVPTVFEAPTVAALAERLGGPTTPDDAFDVVLPLHPHGRRTPLWCVHPATGISWSFHGLTKHLDEDQPLYALQARGLTDPTARPASLQEIAADYADQMLKVQPDGPYQLLGWSAGGLIAHALTAELARRGKRTALLAVLDSYPLTGLAPHERAPLSEQDVLVRVLGCDEEALAAKPLTPERIVEAFRVQGSALGGLAPQQVRTVLDTATRLARLMPDCVPEPYDGDLLVFAATLDGDAQRWDPRAWQPYITGRIETHEVAVGHHQMTRPEALALIGPVLASHLDRTARPAPHPHPTSKES
ncbi:amino acid adenylation domain-containing protein [Streptomyces sp. A73]|nr:amino acid adenylation domain-containing protein [Streptomyces sp. A73]